MIGLQRKQENCHHSFSELNNDSISENVLKSYFICRFNTVLFPRASDKTDSLPDI